MKKTAKPPIERLLRGISTDHVETVRDAWRDLLVQRETSVAAVRTKLASTAWQENPRGPLAKYLGVLLAILEEMDPEAFAQEITRLQNSRLHPLHRKTVDVLSQRMKDEPATFIGRDVPVFVSPEIEMRSVVIGNLERWSRTKGLSLENTTRIDVIARLPQLDYLGLYNILFSGIILTWPNGDARGLRLWYRRLDAEFTFYHEVGHHVLGHIEGGSVREQEQEADSYAHKMMRNSHPILIAVGRLSLWPLRPLMKRLTQKHTRR